MTISNLISSSQDDMYASFNQFSRNHPISGRLLALPIALADVFLDISKYPCTAIEMIARSVFQFLGALFCQNNYTIRTAINFLSVGLSSIPGTAIACAFGIVKLFYQTLAVFYDPNNVNSIRPGVLGFIGSQFVQPLTTFSSAIQDIQDDMCLNFSNFATNYTLIGRVLALPLALTDTLLQTVKAPVTVIERLALSILQFIGALSCQDTCEIKFSITYLGASLENIPASIIVAALFPLRLLYQTLAVFFFPSNVASTGSF